MVVVVVVVVVVVAVDHVLGVSHFEHHDQRVDGMVLRVGGKGYW